MTTFGSVLVEPSPLAPAGAVRVVGDFDIELREPFIDALDAITTKEAQRVVVDLSGVVHFDENGLARLLATRAETAREGLELVIVGAPPCVRARMDIGGVTHVFNLVD